MAELENPILVNFDGPLGAPGQKDDTAARNSLVLFVVGFLCCPVWCCGGVAYARNADTRARLFGVLSLVMCLLGVLAVVTTAALLYAVALKQNSCQAYNDSHNPLLVRAGLCMDDDCGVCKYSDTNAICFAHTSMCRNGRWLTSREQLCPTFTYYTCPTDTCRPCVSTMTCAASAC